MVLCEEVLPGPAGNVHLMDVFSALRPRGTPPFPHKKTQLDTLASPVAESGPSRCKMKLGGRLSAEGTALLGPGEYVPDVPEGISSPEELPKPRCERTSHNDRARRCPRWGARA